VVVPIGLKDKIKRIPNLPTLPQVACHFLQCVNDPGSSSSDVASYVSQDMSLSAKILRLSNSAFYGMPRKIINICEAIVILWI
jgi:HD-like signal output (HDOD) protein